jgi:hypothetical protein
MNPGTGEAEARQALADVAPVDPWATAAIIEGRLYEGFDIEDTLDRVSCPALVLAGNVKLGSRVREEDLEFLRAHTALVRMTRIASGGHGIVWDEPAIVNSEVAGQPSERRANVVSARCPNGERKGVVRMKQPSKCRKLRWPPRGAPDHRLRLLPGRARHASHGLRRAGEFHADCVERHGGCCSTGPGKKDLLHWTAEGTLRGRTAASPGPETVQRHQFAAGARESCPARAAEE